MTDIERIYDLDDAETDSLFAAKAGAHSIEVKQYENLRWLTIDGDAIQSILDVDKPTQILNPVTQIMLSSCYLTDKLDRILNLGMGGGSVERFLSSFLPGSSVTSVEAEEIIIYIAHKYFLIPGSSMVHCIDAHEFIADSSKQFDLILCDMFIEEYHPEFLYQADFYSNIYKNLCKTGIFTINLIPDDQDDLLTILLAIRKSFQYTYLYELPDHYNIIGFASKQPLELKKTNFEDALDASKQLLDKTRFLDSLETLPKI